MERILTLNIGATRLALAEFEVQAGKSPILRQYIFGAMPEGLDSPDAVALGLEESLRGMLAESGIKPGHICVALSGQQAFPRFIKVFSENEEKMREQIQFEVEQNVPFPLDDVIWSDALIGEPEVNEQRVMIVAARKDIANAVTKALLNVGMEPDIVDVAPVALYNAVRFNYNDATGCTLVIDIGAKCTNLVFVEQDRIFYRTIPVAGHTITAEIAKAFQISLEEAEKMKCEQGLVAQGGAFAVEDPQIDRLSKVIRNVMTRLHAEVMRSVSFYRSQQEGNAPERILLTGASAQLPYMQNFFEEKLQIMVDFLNPFQNVRYPDTIDGAQFGQDAFALPVVVGLALRPRLVCPVEINLVSEEIAARKNLRRRVPFFVIAAAGLVFIFGIWLIYVSNMKSLYDKQCTKTQDRVAECERQKNKFDAINAKAEVAEVRAKAYQDLMKKRVEWISLLSATEKAVPKGLWLTSFKGRRQENRLMGVDLVVNAWKDTEPKICTSGKTIDETVAQKLADTPIFSNDVKEIVIGKKDQKTSWLTTFNIFAQLNSIESPKKPSRRTR